MPSLRVYKAVYPLHHAIHQRYLSNVSPQGRGKVIGGAATALNIAAYSPSQAQERYKLHHCIANSETPFITYLNVFILHCMCSAYAPAGNILSILSTT